MMPRLSIWDYFKSKTTEKKVQVVETVAKPTESRVMFGVLYNRPTPAVTRKANLDCINCMDGEQQRLSKNAKPKDLDEK